MTKRRQDLLLGLFFMGLTAIAVVGGVVAWRDSGIRMVWTDSVALAACPCLFVFAAISQGLALKALRDSTSEEG